MKLVTPSLVVEDLDGFKNDVLQRQSFGEALLNLVVHSTDELVISLDGKWGEGKTTFVKMWQGLLKDKGVPSIYINAFQNDYTEDAFISIAGAITSYVDQHTAETQKASDFMDKAKKVGVQLLSWSAKMGIKAATLGIIEKSDIDVLSCIGEDIATDASDAIAKLVKDRLSAHSNKIELVRSFRESLSEMPAALKDNGSGRLVVIVDELDRCKPSFAIEVLEKIKHLFSVKNIVFLLVMHKEQIEETIRCVYGKIDAHTYLQKFINVETAVPKRVSDRSNDDLETYSKKLLRLHELEDWENKEHFINYLVPLARHFNLSLRQLEKVFTNMAVMYSTSDVNDHSFVSIINFICVVKVDNPSVFSKLLIGKISYSDLCEQLGLSAQDGKNASDRKLSRIMDWVRFSMLTDSEFQEVDSNDPIRRFGEMDWSFDCERERLLSTLCQKLSMFIVN